MEERVSNYPRKYFEFTLYPTKHLGHLKHISNAMHKLETIKQLVMNHPNLVTYHNNGSYIATHMFFMYAVAIQHSPGSTVMYDVNS